MLPASEGHFERSRLINFVVVARASCVRVVRRTQTACGPTPPATEFDAKPLLSVSVSVRRGTVRPRVNLVRRPRKLGSDALFSLLLNTNFTTLTQMC
jgi:hypothetical protein